MVSPFSGILSHLGPRIQLSYLASLENPKEVLATARLLPTPLAIAAFVLVLFLSEGDVMRLSMLDVGRLRFRIFYVFLSLSLFFLLPEVVYDLLW